MKKCFLAIVYLLLSLVLYAQEQDSLINFTNSDSLVSPFSDSLSVSDSLAVIDSNSVANNDIDAVVYASAKDSIIFDLTNKQMYVYGEGEINYKNSTLNGGEIEVDFLKTELRGRGIVDTADTTSLSYLQTPVLSEGEEVYEGQRLKYNFKNQKGFIYLATNKKEGSQYRGNRVKKVDRKTYFIEHGIYTTCEAEQPHTHFEASQMKVIQNDKIIGKWIFMYVAGVPIPIPVPFAVIPNETGRRSGIIIPTFGTQANTGSYFRNFGYFFALSDYMDLTLTGDYYTRGGFGAATRFRYAKRYKYSGNLDASFSKQLLGEADDPSYSKTENWKVYYRHNQKFNPTTSLDVNLQFQTANYYKSNSTDYNNILQQDIISNATFNKRWKSGNNLTINYKRRQNLETNDITETLPSISFTNPIFYPFRSSSGGQSSKQPWYESVGLSYNGNFENQREKITGNLSTHGGIRHTLRLNSNSKVGYFNVAPSVNFNSKWYNKYTEVKYEPVEVDSLGNPTTYGEVDYEKKGYNFIQTYDVNLSASTKLFGMMQPNSFGIAAVRHTFEPRITYTYKPDFGEDKFGYYDYYADTSGNNVKYDKFSNEVYGGAGQGESQMLSYSMSHIFEMKTIKDPTDTTSQQKKIRLLNITTGVNYNFAADSLKLSDVNISYRTQISDLLNFNMTTGYTFYDYQDGHKIDKFLASEGRGLFRLTNLGFNLSTSISGEKLAGSSEEDKEKRLEREDYEQEQNTLRGEQDKSMYSRHDPDFSIPWNLSLNYTYNLSKQDPAKEARFQSRMGFNLGFNLTNKWKISTSGSYDFITHEFGAPQITIFRDLECWEMNFSWNPLGTYRGFRFEIKMTAPQLKDLKVTKSGGLYTGYGGY